MVKSIQVARVVNGKLIVKQENKWVTIGGKKVRIEPRKPEVHQEPANGIARIIVQLKDRGIKPSVKQHPKTGLWHGIDWVGDAGYPSSRGFENKQDAEADWYENKARGIGIRGESTAALYQAFGSKKVK